MSSPRLIHLAGPVIAAATAATLLTACSSSGTKTGAPATTTSSAAPLTGSITVFAASSLTGAFTDIGKAFEAARPGTKVTFSFGASSTLAQQIIQGPPRTSLPRPLCRT